LNRPEKRNALSEALLGELSAALWAADEDTRVHAVILRGNGPDFSSGYDLGHYEGEAAAAANNKRGRKSFDDDAWRLERSQRLRMAIFDMHKPVIAQVHGRCLAGGADLALLCDMVICAEDARFGFPPARSQGSLPNHMWLYLVGPQWAKRLLLTGDQILGADAARIGLVMKAVPAADLEAEVEALAARLALIDADLLSCNKRIVNLGLELMGTRTLQRLAAEMDARGHLAASREAFRRDVMEKGIKEAARLRDEPFGDGLVRP
jgi:enoyl-CoA hydratase